MTADWDQMLQKWANQEACEANTQLLFGSPVDNPDGVIEVDYHSFPSDCVNHQTRNFALPLSSLQVDASGRYRLG